LKLGARKLYSDIIYASSQLRYIQNWETIKTTYPDSGDIKRQAKREKASLLHERAAELEEERPSKRDRKRKTNADIYREREREREREEGELPVAAR
jgi:hypothetical protein